jgi:hypothetical protein
MMSIKNYLINSNNIFSPYNNDVNSSEVQKYVNIVSLHNNEYLNVKKHSYNKNIYTINNNDNNTYIFELMLKDVFNNNTIIRKIRKTNKGCIISQNDNISFDLIKKYKLTIINLNDIEKSVTIKNNINKPKIVFNKDDIYLEIKQTPQNFIEFKYVIN